MTAVIGFALTFILKPLAYVLAAAAATGAAVVIGYIAFCLGIDCYEAAAKRYGRLNDRAERLACTWHGRYLEMKLSMLFDTEKTATKALRATGGFMLLAVATLVLAPSYMLSDMIWKAFAESQYLHTIPLALAGSALLVVARPALHFAWTLLALDTDEWLYETLTEMEVARFNSEHPNARQADRDNFQRKLRSNTEYLRFLVAEARRLNYLCALRDLYRLH